MAELTGLNQRQQETDASFRILWQREFGLSAADLTPKEIEILHHLAQGHLNKQIANSMEITEQTTKNHVSSIMKKLSAGNRTQAVMRAARFGIISL